jgi:flagellar basal body rod protein FlgG
MEAQQNQLDAVANDLSNIDTPGYQGEIVGFQDLLYTSGGGSTGTQAATGAGSASSIVGRSNLQGAIHQSIVLLNERVNLFLSHLSSPSSFQ